MGLDGTTGQSGALLYCLDVLYDSKNAPTDFTYRFWGTANTTMHKVDVTGKSVDTIRSPVTRKSTVAQYIAVTKKKQASRTAYTIHTVDHAIPHTQVSLRMPASNDGERVDQIITFTDWRDDFDAISKQSLEAYGE